MHDISPHTIFLLVGPTKCGKTYFVDNYLKKKLMELKPLENRDVVSVCYISSDEIRRFLIGQNYEKENFAMMAASKSAFDVLYSQIDAATTFPVNAEFVIVDTKGTNENFRNKVFDIAEKNNYNVAVVLFNYKDFNDYSRFCAMNKELGRDIKRVRELSGYGLKKRRCVKQVIQIKSPDNFDEQVELSFNKHELYSKCFVSNKKNALVVSDIHGCYDEFIELLGKYNITVEDHKMSESDFEIIINGDYIDKGPKSLDMIDFCYFNNIHVVIGNHENRLYKELIGELEHLSDPWFDTFNVIDDVHKERFKAVFERSVPFVMNDKFIATHAPANIRHLGKLDNKSLSRQRYCSKEDSDIYKQLEAMGIFENECVLHHLFGHIPTCTPKTISRRSLIDGGCCVGGTLVAAEIAYDGKLYMKSVPSRQEKTENLQVYKLTRDLSSEFDSKDLNEKELGRVNHLVEDKVNFISGTMSPCAKFDNELETIESAIDFFKSNNIMDIVMEPKYMGSRMNMYLFEDNEHSYCVSRGGYPIRIDRLNKLYDKMRAKLKIDWNDTLMVLIDGECMPWKAIGDGLIRDFKLVNENLAAENKFLIESGFEDKFNELMNFYNSTDFKTEKNLKNKAALSEQYGKHIYRILSCLYDYNHVSVEDKERMRAVYEEQLRIFGSDAELDYKPFAILKIVKKSGEEICWYLQESDMTNEKMFNMVNDEPCYRYDLRNPQDVEACIKQFKQYTTVEKREGVVVKPNNLLNKQIPYMKVRNPEYLTIVYGYDYRVPFKYKKLYDRKSINSKLRMSRSEWNKGLDMLKVKYADITPDNNVIKNLFAKFIAEDRQGEKLDPRL